MGPRLVVGIGRNESTENPLAVLSVLEEASQFLVANWPEVTAVLIASTSLAITIYKEFIQGYELEAAIGSVFILRVPGQERQALTNEILLYDVTDASPSPQAQDIAAMVAGAGQERLEGSRRQAAQQLAEFQEATGEIFQYNPPDGRIASAIGDPRFKVPLLVPLEVHNSGRRFAQISSLVLLAQHEETNQLWAFGAFVEVDRTALMERREEQQDLDRLGDFFTGIGVAPMESERLNPFFTPLSDLDGVEVAEQGMPPGTYSVRVLGYDGQDKKVLETDSVDLLLTENSLVEAFKGGDSGYFPHLERHVGLAVGARDGG